MENTFIKLKAEFLAKAKKLGACLEAIDELNKGKTKQDALEVFKKNARWCIINNFLTTKKLLEIFTIKELNSVHIYTSGHNSIVTRGVERINMITFGNSQAKVKTFDNSQIKTDAREFGYCILPFGNTKRGWKMTDEQRRKVSIANKGRKRTAEQNAANSMRNKGKKLSKERRQKLKYGLVNAWLNKPQVFERMIEMHRRPVIKISMDGTELSEYSSLKEAAKSHNLKRLSSILNVVSGRKPTAAGYIWRYKNECIHPNNINRKTARQTKDKSDGSLTSRFVGVHWSKQGKKWMTQLCHKSKRYNIGYFDDEKQAAIAYNDKLKELGLPIIENVEYV